jgi:hypothetical protein
VAVAPLDTVGVGVVPGAGKSIFTEAVPALQAVTLQAVIWIVTVSFDVNVAASAVEPGGAGAATPFTTHRVVVYVPVTAPVHVTPAVRGVSV